MHRFITILFFLPIFLFASEKRDSLPVYFYEDAVNDTFFVDTTINNFQQYTIRNTIGNCGLAEFPLLLTPSPSALGFRYFTNYYYNYYIVYNNMKFYSTLKPYTDVSVYLGQKKEQIFKMIHTQNVNERFNFSIGFNRIRTEGWYQRQNVNHNNVSLNINYKNKKNNYHLLGGGIYNNIQCAENGGILKDSIFENVDFADKKLITVNLSSAQRKMTNNSIFIKQLFYLRKSSSDSLNKKEKSYYFSHSVNYSNEKIIYVDDFPASGYYNSIFTDSVRTLDSVNYYKIENDLSFNFRRNNTSIKKEKFRSALLLKHQYVDLKSASSMMIDSMMQNILIRLTINGHSKFNKWNYSVVSEYNLSGANTGDYNANVTTGYALDTSVMISVNLGFENRTPDFIFGKYYSNHNQWNNLFEKTQSSYQQLTLKWNKYKFSLNLSSYQYLNYLYFDNVARPRQYNDDMLVLYSACLDKKISIGNWRLNNRVSYQYIPDSIVIRLPELYLIHSLYYQKILFKKALQIQAGIDLIYYSSYYSNSYSPALGQFYIQNEKKIGGYPYFDFFINMKIKNAKFFVKLEHINSGILKTPYYAAPSMPFYDRALKVGINWRFDD